MSSRRGRSREGGEENPLSRSVGGHWMMEMLRWMMLGNMQHLCCIWLGNGILGARRVSERTTAGA